ncbi:MAG: dTDP-4-dehydrorhamnose reductase [Thermoanaerobaculaceae bacterium]|nr:dTDP-4-dehydrorhamnose reductase [Thermoanaerobaculaceae bacterium]MDI9623234.1 dTDP-4-dehydrorhamnose reductase [Acidobacteriota bacterium]NLH11301.1 dTDP-4-dehydrorhamnose reductase [Holophagae bacterium]HPW56604.1 dTDP-4-dehydrorhamnose reductase [Thermoanaerobaculaceae bacterium]
MRLLVTGSQGQLGRALGQVGPARGHVVAGYDLPELDITDAVLVQRAVAGERPDAIVNCAAFTAVDAAEADEARATAVNGEGVANLAVVANAVGAVLVHISTDYVFDGRPGRPWREDDPTGPLSAYGRSKLAGERVAILAAQHLVVRTAWLFGKGWNFVEAIRIQLEEGRDPLAVVSDQIGSPTYAVDLAEALVELLEIGARGVVHAVNEGVTSWHGFAGEIVRLLGVHAEVRPISSSELNRPALRPANSVLDTARLRGLLGHGLPPWQDALGRYLQMMGRERME